MTTDYYTPSDLDDEMFISEVPIELLKELIMSQFNDPLEDCKHDYMQSFITKYNFTKDNMIDDDVFLLDNLRDGFIAFLERTFQEKLSVGFDTLDQLNEEDQHEILHLTYRFFIKNIKKNFTNLILNFLDSNKNDILSKYKINKDITSLTFKEEEILDEYDLTVLSNLNSIIEFILSEVRECNDVDKFFDLIRGDEMITEVEYVDSKFENLEITGNFIPSYIDMVDSYFISELYGRVRNRILKKYPYRKNKSLITKEEENIDDTSSEE